MSWRRFTTLLGGLSVNSVVVNVERSKAQVKATVSRGPAADRTIDADQDPIAFERLLRSWASPVPKDKLN